MQKLNASRLLCPMPVIKTQNMIKTMSQGEMLEVICTDHGTLQDIPAWCRINGHIINKITEEELSVTFYIIVGTKD
ncbi:MAG: tRNA 2-thiouridine synthesizing protein A [Francisellaceae bacterium]|jgi:tRNA 2-thiouridine synthesizing protein A